MSGWMDGWMRSNIREELQVREEEEEAFTGYTGKLVSPNINVTQIICLRSSLSINSNPVHHLAD